MDDKKSYKRSDFCPAETLAIGDRIKSLRGNVSRKEFAKKFNVALNTIIRYENGVNFPDAGFVAGLCREYNVSSDWVIFGKEADIKTESNYIPEKSKNRLKSLFIASASGEASALDLSLAEFEELWDEYRGEKEGRRGWLQVEVIKRFPEFLVWLEQRGERLVMPRSATLTRAGLVNQGVEAMGLEDE